ncbi:hypothetical protein [Nonomuraea sediminis]|uniref:hypothetical protein n=1 Tax=Nonomuraea sediminis TaxID=2835864 RepID=UPI001BDC952B|nr:hypothetical protein [Nonomuraea sediminis]
MNGSLAGFEERRLAELKEYVAARAARRPRRRLVLATAAAAAVVAGVSVVTVSSTGGRDTAYAVTKDSDGIVYVIVRDFHDAAGLTRQLRSLNVPAVVDYVPAGKKCAQEPRGAYVEDIPRGLYQPPTNIPGAGADEQGWQMRIDTKLFKPGQTFVWTLSDDPVYDGTETSTILMRNPVAPCELVPDDTPHYIPQIPGPSAGYAGKTVGQVLPELNKRGVKVTYLITEPAPDPHPLIGNQYVMYPTKQNTPVGEDWHIWNTDEPQPGQVRLMVTQKLAAPS